MIELHKLLMPPHLDGSIYSSSALCSCGEWQYDADTPHELYILYRYILKEHTDHIRRIEDENSLG